MERVVQQVVFPMSMQPKAKRVAAYARVSSGKDAMLHSLSTQVSSYSSMIQNHPGWLYCGVFSDEAISGTKNERNGFQQLIDECRAGRIDLIITKSISRFARNTLTLLETVRELKDLGVDIYFEEQNIHTMSADGELMLTIMASYAQEESLSVSENQKWRVRKNFEAGIPWNATMLGYRMKDGKLVIEPEEAEIVKQIFSDYLEGLGYHLIAEKLNKQEVATRRGQLLWGRSSVRRVLNNYAYTGNLLLQSSFRENHMAKYGVPNNGELPKYHVENAHEAIIPLDTFLAVQHEMERKKGIHYKGRYQITPFRYTGMMTCGTCGKPYRRRVSNGKACWICGTFYTRGKAFCASKQVPETTLDAAVAEVAGSAENIDHIFVYNGNRLVFKLKDGTEVEKIWKDRSRSESWTPEMREAMRQKKLAQGRVKNEC